MEIKDIKLFFYPKDRLRMTIGNEKSYITIKPAWASPISHPDKFLTLLDSRDEEIIMINDPDVLDTEAREVLFNELKMRYLTSTILSIISLKEEFGVFYWNVVTDRGEREIVAKGLHTNAIWYSDTHLLLLDVYGNRFEIPDIESLDEKSRSQLLTIV